MTTTFESAEVGDRVFDYAMQEWGTIVEVREEQFYRFAVTFKTLARAMYSADGRPNGLHKIQLLFWDEVPPIVAPSKPVEVPHVDTLVRVWGDCKDHSKLRYSAGIMCGNRLECWTNGATSKTTSGDTLSWKYWEIVND